MERKSAGSFTSQTASQSGVLTPNNRIVRKKSDGTPFAQPPDNSKSFIWNDVVIKSRDGKTLYAHFEYLSAVLVPAGSEAGSGYIDLYAMIAGLGWHSGPMAWSLTLQTKTKGTVDFWSVPTITVQCTWTQAQPGVWYNKHQLSTEQIGATDNVIYRIPDSNWDPC